ncbi:hypothetical protein GQ457_03G004200 [Hibiscus cannabinus]
MEETWEKMPQKTTGQDEQPTTALPCFIRNLPNLLQHLADGAIDTSAVMQGQSCRGSHTAASAMRVSPENSTTASATTHKATKEILCIFLFLLFFPTQGGNVKLNDILVHFGHELSNHLKELGLVTVISLLSN